MHVDLSPSELHQRYIVEQKSTNEIARELGCTASAVGYQLKQAGIPRRTMRECGALQASISDAELRELLERGLSMMEIVRETGISYPAIFNHAVRLGIKPPRDRDWRIRQVGHTTESVLALCEKHSVTHVARETGLSTLSINNLMARQGFHRPLRISPFWLTASAELAYVLGLLYADGSTNGWHVTITQKEPELIARIAGLAERNMPVQATNAKGFSYYTLLLGGKDLASYLADCWGYTGLKVSRACIPNNMPSAYMRDFIRGYFDGDGGVNLFHREHGKGWDRSIHFTSSNQEFLVDIASELHALGLPLHIPLAVTRSKAWRLRYGGFAQLGIFHQTIYYDDCLCWSTKHDKLMRALVPTTSPCCV
jgi:DNA-binding CsgD family transcriptional regulator